MSSHDYYEPEEKCQAWVSATGHQCKRQAKIKFDLRKQRKFFGYNLPTVNCCYFCLQHTAVYMGCYISQLSYLLATKDLTWDEYITVSPDYLDRKLKEMENKEE